MWPTKWGSSLKDDKLLPDIGNVGASPTGGGNNGGSPYSLPSFVPDHQQQQQQHTGGNNSVGSGNNAGPGNFGGSNGGGSGTAPSNSGDPLYDTISTMTQAQSTSIYTPPLGTSLGNYLII